MNRLIYNKLYKWSISINRKPLILQGARQVGKTFAIRNLSTKFPSFVEINFELMPEAIEVFKADLNPDRLIRDLALLSGKRIIAGETLLFLDEIQLAPRAVTALRYFYELLPSLHVIAAGSHLGFAVDEVGIPVGRVTLATMYPVSFLEFLCASGCTQLAGEIVRHDPRTPMPETLHQKALDLLGQYLAVGGMPQAVTEWLEQHDIDACRMIHRDIIRTYRQDLDKYGGRLRQKYVRLLFDAVPRQLGRKFRYHEIHGEYRKRELAPALELLAKICVVHKIFHTSAQGVPLGAAMDPDIFKTIFVDVALAQTVLGIPPGDWIIRARDSLANKGEIVEAYVGQEILAYQNPAYDETLYYWVREAKSSNAEVDYVIQKQNVCIPIEVKSGSSGWLRSMHRFLDEHPAAPFGLRFHAGNYRREQRIHSFPLYAVCGAMEIEKDMLESLLQ